MKQLLPTLLFLPLLPALISATTDSTGLKFAGTLEPEAKTNWGQWGEWQYCPPPGSFVSGFQLKVQEKQGIYDDTALNSVRMACSRNGLWEITTLESASGNKGYWRNWNNCSKFYTGIEFRSEPPQGILKDDTAGNNVRLLCDGNWQDGGGLDWGSWTGPKECPKNSFICGFRTKVEQKKPNDDKTGLNAIEVKCCYR